MLRDLSRSTLYSSSCPSSSSATRRSSFSTLMINLLPVLRRDSPRIRFTCSIIMLKIFGSHRGKSGVGPHLVKSNTWLLASRRNRRRSGRSWMRAEEALEKVLGTLRRWRCEGQSAKRPLWMGNVGDFPAGVCFGFDIGRIARLRHVGILDRLRTVRIFFVLPAGGGK